MGPCLFRTDDLTRRRFVAHAAGTLLGVGLLPEAFLPRGLSADPLPPKLPATAKQVIYLYMSGGMSHLDTLDPKAGPTAGPTKAIASAVPGVRVSEHLPRIAKQLHLATVVRSLTSTQGAHEQGNYKMHTSYNLRGTVRHPGMGAWLSALQGGGHPSLPNHVYIGDDSGHPGAGFLPPVHGPLALSNPEGGLKNAIARNGGRLGQRLGLAAELDRDFRTAFPHRNVKAYADMYDQALAMMASADLEAFDLSKEPDAVRQAYGKGGFGQGCLLARRLIERKVRFVEVSLGGWDTHTANFVKVPEQCDLLDRGLAALLGDLNDRGQLKETLVVLTTEFGRTPEINLNQGRDHYPKAFSTLLAGGGIAAGRTFGQTDAKGAEVASDVVSIPDFNATIAHALGLPLDHVTHSPDKRPFTVADKGKPVLKLFG